MKKIYFFVAILATSFTANAQRQVGVSRAMNATSSSTIAASNQQLVATDTVSAGFDWANANPLLQGVVLTAGGGYVVGTNGYGDEQKAQVFSLGTPAVISGALYWFGAKTVTTSNSIVKMRVYNIDDMGNSTSSPDASTFDTPCPGTAAVSDDVPLSQVDTSSSLETAYIHMFSTPVYRAGDFAIGFDVTGVNFAGGDTIGLVTTSDGEANSSIGDYTWEQWSDGSWHSLEVAWPLFLEMGIFAIVELNTGVNETPFINGAKLGIVGGNPFTDLTTVNYTLQNGAQDVQLSVLDATGKVVLVQNMGDQAAGQYRFDINGTNMAAGTYFVTLQAGAARIATRIVKN